MSRLTFISVLSIIILVLASLVQWQSTEVSDSAAQQQRRAAEPDFYMLDATVTQFNNNGTIKQLMQAQRIEHFPHGDFILTDTPKITLFDSNRTPWYISADRGRGEDSNDVIDLWDNVLLHRNIKGNTQNLKTKKLTLITSKNLAKTDQDVVITDALRHITATGMKAYIEENRIEFLSNVRAIHDPAKVN